jgi:hypothetical protein
MSCVLVGNGHAVVVSHSWKRRGPRLSYLALTRASNAVCRFEVYNFMVRLTCGQLSLYVLIPSPLSSANQELQSCSLVLAEPSPPLGTLSKYLEPPPLTSERPVEAPT